MRCHHAILDGAYVLGSLAPAERREFSEHLAGCDQCSTSVQELAGLPGLLAQVDLTDLETTASRAPVPPTLLPTLVRETRRAQRHRTALVAAVAASVAAVVMGALAVGASRDDPGSTDSTGTPTTSVTAQPTKVPMIAVGPSPVSAEILVSSLAWGTRLDLTCSYESVGGDGGYGSSPAPQYALVVRTRDGRADEIATWHGLPGRTMQLSAATAISRSDIESVEMRTADGMVVLRLRI